jgi:hypothetical protein
MGGSTWALAKPIFSDTDNSPFDPAQVVPIAVKLRMHIVDILPLTHVDINIIAVNSERSDIPRWRHSRQANAYLSLIMKML